MTKRMTYLASAAFFALGAISASSAQAAYVATFEQVGADVVETGGGTIDLTDLTGGDHRQSVFPQIIPDLSVFVSGTEFSEVTIYEGVTGPGNFGAGGMTSASLSSGDGIVLGSGELDVPEGYTSGSPLSETSTYVGSSIVSLGLAPGAYVWNWGAGDHADSFTINVVTSPPLPVPEPSTWAMMLLGFAGLGYAAVRRQGAVRAISA